MVFGQHGISITGDISSAVLQPTFRTMPGNYLRETWLNLQRAFKDKTEAAASFIMHIHSTSDR